MQDIEQQIVAYYLRLCREDDDNAEARTCKRFNITEDSLMIILMADFVDNH